MPEEDPNSIHSAEPQPSLAATRRRMQRTRSRDNPFEIAVRSRLHAAGLRYRVHFALPNMIRRTCDIAFPKKRVAIFLDGCFWHGCPIHGTASKTNADFWDAKIRRNRDRDAATNLSLEAQGWVVKRFWEHDDIENIVQTIMQTVRG